MKKLQIIMGVNNEEKNLITTNYIIKLEKVFRVGEIIPLDINTIDLEPFIGRDIGICTNTSGYTDYSIPCGALVFLINEEDICKKN